MELEKNKIKINKRIFEHEKVQLLFRRAGWLSDLCSRQLGVETRYSKLGRVGRIKEIGLKETVYTLTSHTVVLEPAALAPPGSLVEFQSLRPHPRLTESELHVYTN